MQRSHCSADPVSAPVIRHADITQQSGNPSIPNKPWPSALPVTGAVRLKSKRVSIGPVNYRLFQCVGTATKRAVKRPPYIFCNTAITRDEGSPGPSIELRDSLSPCLEPM